MEVKEIGLDDFIILPPMKGLCPKCAVAHDPARPHDRNSLYYQMRFRQKHGRFPTWADAMRHCDEKVKAAWRAALSEHGVKPEELEDGPKRMDNVRQQGADEKRLP